MGCRIWKWTCYAHSWNAKPLLWAVSTRSMVNCLWISGSKWCETYLLGSAKTCWQVWPRVLWHIIQNLLWENPKLPALVVWLASTRCRSNNFFDLLHTEMETKKYAPKQIFNVDESGITTVQTPGKILSCEWVCSFLMAHQHKKAI